MNSSLDNIKNLKEYINNTFVDGSLLTGSFKNSLTEVIEHYEHLYRQDVAIDEAKKSISNIGLTQIDNVHYHGKLHYGGETYDEFWSIDVEDPTPDQIVDISNIEENINKKYGILINIEYDGKF